MAVPNSGRFYWCLGCGRWHDPLKQVNMHFLMYWPYQEPNENNFDGTLEELQRFKGYQAYQKHLEEGQEIWIDKFVTDN